MDGAVLAEPALDFRIGESDDGLGLPVHPVANLFPLLQGDDFARLVTDIKKNGLREPITTTRDGRIIDGRNRYRACVAASIAPRTAILDMDDAELLAWVLSRNLHRRHLTTAQRAAIAAELASLKPGAKPANLPIWLSQAEAAAMLKESPRSLRSVSGIKEASPELHELIKAGRLSTNLAQRIVGLPGGERKKFVELIKSGDVKGAKAKLKAKLTPRCESQNLKSKTTATAAKADPKKNTKPTPNGLPAVYEALLMELDALPEHLASNPLARDSALVVSAALEKALAMIETCGIAAEQVA